MRRISAADALVHEGCCVHNSAWLSCAAWLARRRQPASRSFTAPFGLARLQLHRAGYFASHRSGAHVMAEPHPRRGVVDGFGYARIRAPPIPSKFLIAWSMAPEVGDRGQRADPRPRLMSHLNRHDAGDLR